MILSEIGCGEVYQDMISSEMGCGEVNQDMILGEMGCGEVILNCFIVKYIVNV